MDVGCARIGPWDPPSVERDVGGVGRCSRARADRYRMNGFWFIEFMGRGGRTMPMRRRVDADRNNARWDRKRRRSFERTYRRRRSGPHPVISVGNEERARQPLTYGCCRIDAPERN